MDSVFLSTFDLFTSFTLIILLSGLSIIMRLKLAKQILIAAIRTVLQLSLIGIVLKVLFSNVNPYFILSLILFMILVAGYEIGKRQKRSLKGIWTS